MLISDMLRVEYYLTFNKFNNISHLPKTRNTVITWRGAKISPGNLNILLGGGEDFWPDKPKSAFETVQFLQPFQEVYSQHWVLIV